MPFYFWIAAALLLILLLILIASYVCYRLVFYSAPRHPLPDGEYEIPPGRVYDTYRARIIEWTEYARKTPHEKIEITSHDGLTLRGRYYEYQKGAPTELLFHGYRGNAERDLSGGIARCHALGRNALIIDQRAAGTSDGSVISFGINERRDYLLWIEEARRRFGEDTPLILTGVSMGAATVLLAAAQPLPKNVVGVLADCPYSSQRAIIKRVIRKMHLPADLFYPLVRLGARIFGKFDLEEVTPIEEVTHLTVPVVYIHGDADTFVPCEMSQALYDATVAPDKHLFFILGAQHGLAFPTDEEGYLDALRKAQSTWF